MSDYRCEICGAFPCFGCRDVPEYLYYCPETEDIFTAFYKTRKTRAYSQMFGESEEIYFYIGEL